MGFSDLDRQMLRVPWTLYCGDANNIDVTPGNNYIRTVPFNCALTAIRVSAQAATGSSQFVVEILRATTIIATLTSAVPYVAGVVVALTGLDLRLSENDILTVRVRGSNADTDDLFGMIIEAVLQPLAPAPSI